MEKSYYDNLIGLLYTGIRLWQYKKWPGASSEFIFENGIVGGGDVYEFDLIHYKRTLGI